MKNIQVTITPGSEESTDKVGVLLEGELQLKYLYEVVEDIKSAFMQYEHITIKLKNIVNIDLACIQLLFSIKQSAQIANKTFACHMELPADAQNILTHAGLSNLASLLNNNGQIAK